jgi:DNA-binding response OmpR family regulator
MAAPIIICIDALSRRVISSWRLLDHSRQLVSPQGTCLALSALEMALCHLFVQQPGKIVARRQIAEAFGHDWLDFDQRRLDTLISRLRQRWRCAAASELPLKTEHREGYSFVAPITVG